MLTVSSAKKHSRLDYSKIDVLSAFFFFSSYLPAFDFIVVVVSFINTFSLLWQRKGNRQSSSHLMFITISGKGFRENEIQVGVCCYCH